jgi:hypothetical protein
MLYHVNSFRQGVYEIPFENEVIQNSTTLALQSVFSRLQVDLLCPTLLNSLLTHLLFFSLPYQID